MSSSDLIVVGTGVFGLIAAHTWLELNPNDNVMLFEAGPDLGGVWAKSRVYSSMMTQTPENMFHYSCYPMLPCPKNETFYGLFPGSYVGNYLEAFSTHKLFAGKTIRERIMFDAAVRHITKVDGCWHVEVLDKSYDCKKLIIATGLTSIPTPINIRTTNFKAPIIHSRNLAANEALLASPEIKHVVVLGGAKSAFDTVQLLHSLGKKVTWIIRTHGQGPAYLAPPDAPWPLSNSHEIISMKLFAKMSPCIFEPPDAWTRFYHSNRFGIWLVDVINAQVGKMWTTAAGYGRSENMKQLVPDRPAFWSSDGIAVLNSKDLWDTISQATILRDNVESFSDNQIVLESGKAISCDAVVAAIGWSNHYPFFGTPLAKELGVPLLPAEADVQTMSAWETRIKIANGKVVETFPRLANVPTYPDHAAKSTPSRLYRGMVPIDVGTDHSIAFVGAIGTVQSMAVAEVQVLWAAAYLLDKLLLPTSEEMRDNVALATAWRRRRYLGDGPTFIYDQIQYTGMLLRDLRLNDQRKGGGWREILFPYEAKDYSGILEEWKAAHY